MPDFGIGEAITALVTSAVGADAATVIAPAIEGALVGGGLGGVESGLTGGNVGKGILHGAEGGAITGGGIGIGGDVIGGAAGDIVGGAGGGALGNFIQGNSPLVGAVEGAAAGGLASLNTPGAPGSTSSLSGSAAGLSPAASAAPPGLSAADDQQLLNIVGNTGEPGSPSGAPVSTAPGQITTGPVPSPVSALDAALGTSGAGGLNGLTSQTPSSPADLSGGTSNNSTLTPPSLSSPGSPVNFFNDSGANVAGTGGLPSNSTLASSIANNENASFNAGAPSGGTPNFGSGLGPEFKAGGAPSLTAPTGFDSMISANAAPATAPSTGSTFLKGLSGPIGQTGTNFVNMLEANPGALISGGGLAYSALKGNQPVAGEKQLDAQANQLATQGEALQNYLQTGTLPPGVQASINQAAEAQKAQIRSRYAQMGGTGSSGMEQELAAVDQWAQGQGAQTAMQLLTTGINESGLASKLYETQVNSAIAQDDALGTAIGQFGAALSGGGGTGTKGTLTFG